MSLYIEDVSADVSADVDTDADTSVYDKSPYIAGDSVEIKEEDSPKNAKAEEKYDSSPFITGDNVENKAGGASTYDKSPFITPFVTGTEVETKSGGASGSASGGASAPVQKIIERIGLGGECAPTAKPDGQGICSSRYSLEKMRQWLSLTRGLKPREIVEEAKNKTGCDSESCVYKKIGLPGIDETFNPSGPWRGNNWLSNVNIDQVLGLQAKNNSRFHHIPFQMIDFEQTGGALARVDWVSDSKDYDSLGCIINTDVSTGPGKHWVAFYVDYLGGTVEYFDSAAQPVPREIMALTSVIATDLGFREVNVTRMEHQTGQSECGVYSIFYILSRLAGVPSKFFEHTRVPDSDMEELRALIFRRGE